MKDIMEWFVGPQLIGLVFLFVGWIQKTWPPKKINSFYGYRSETSKKSQEAWDEGNRYSAVYMMKAGLVCFIVGGIATTLIKVSPMPGNVKFAISYLLILIATMGSALTMLSRTERHLENMFGDK